MSEKKTAETKPAAPAAVEPEPVAERVELERPRVGDGVFVTNGDGYIPAVVTHVYPAAGGDWLLDLTAFPRGFAAQPMSGVHAFVSEPDAREWLGKRDQHAAFMVPADLV